MASTVQELRTWDDAIVLQFSEPNRYEFLIRKTGEAWQPRAVAMSLAYGVAIFAEVKMENFTNPRPYRDTLGDQQLFLFPLIEKLLKCPVRIVRVQVVDVG